MATTIDAFDLLKSDFPTTLAGRRTGMASMLSILLHGAVIAAALSGLWPKAEPPKPPPEMVVEVVLEPPPPPMVSPPPEPQVKPQPVVRQLPAPTKPIARVKPAPVPMATTPSPDAAAQEVAPPPPPVATSEKTATPESPVRDTRPYVDPELTKIYLAGIVDRVKDRLVYPSLSLRRGEEGTVHVQTFLSRDGQVKDVSAEDETVSGRLRDAAIKAVKDAAPYPHLPESVPGDPVKVTIPVVFALR